MIFGREVVQKIWFSWKYFSSILRNFHKKKVNDLIALVKAKGGLDFAIQKMEEYKSQAKQLLSDFPKNEYRDALELMLNYVTERKI